MKSVFIVIAEVWTKDLKRVKDTYVDASFEDLHLAQNYVEYASINYRHDNNGNIRTYRAIGRAICTEDYSKLQRTGIL